MSDEKRCVLLASTEFLGNILNLPPGATVYKIEWEDRRRLFKIYVKGTMFGTAEPEPPLEHDARVDGITHYIVNWPAATIIHPTLTAKTNVPPINLGQKFPHLKVVDHKEEVVDGEAGKTDEALGDDGLAGTSNP